MRNLNAFQQLAEMKITKKGMEDKRKEVLSDDQWVQFEEITKELTKEDIKKMTPEEILNLNRIDDETVFIGVPDFEKDEEVVDYLRDMFAFLKDLEKFTTDLDKSMDELESIMKNSNAELKQMLQESGDNNVVTMMRKTLADAIERSEGNNETLLGSKEAFEDSFDLNRLKKLYTEIGGENLKKDAETNAMDVYRRYVRANKELGLSYDLAMVPDLEQKFLSEKYHDMNNMFVFICMRYISRLTKNRGAKKSTDGLFASQLSTNIYMLTQDSLPKEDKERLVKAIEELLEIVK